MRNKSEAPDERDALVERLREFIRFGFATGPEARMIVTAIFSGPPTAGWAAFQQIPSTSRTSTA